MAEPGSKAKSILDQLKEMTVVVSDSGDFNSIEEFRPRDATTNPSLLFTAAQMDAYKDVVRSALSWARTKAGDDTRRDEIVRLAADRLAIEFGLRILRIIEGRVSTEVDARLSCDTGASVNKARAIIKSYEEAGASRERILIKISSTWEGMCAARILEKEGIHCNMTLLFGLHQAVAAADAGVTLISPFVGRILDWYLKEEKRDSYPPAEDPGVVSVKRIYNYYKHFDYPTQIMGASFRNTGEILELAGCDLLTISPKLLAELSAMHGTLERRLDQETAKAMPMERLHFDEQGFRRAHEQDRMASDKLKQGIIDFAAAQTKLEEMLGERLAEVMKA